MQKISQHISWREATHSQTAVAFKIDNTPSLEVLEKMMHLAENVFEPLRKWYGKPIRVNSFYRSPKLNEVLKGSKNSQHMVGEAIDISAGSPEENKKLFDYIKDNLTFDKLIDEYNFRWVHVSLKKTGNRKQILKIG